MFELLHPPKWLVVCYAVLALTLQLIGFIVGLLKRRKAQHLGWKRFAWVPTVLGILLIFPFTLMNVSAEFHNAQTASWMVLITVLFAAFWFEQCRRSENLMVLYTYGLIEVLVGYSIAYYSVAAKTRDYTFENCLGVLAAMYVAREGFGIIFDAYKSRRAPEGEG